MAVSYLFRNWPHPWRYGCLAISDVEYSKPSWSWNIELPIGLDWKGVFARLVPVEPNASERDHLVTSQPWGVHGVQWRINQPIRGSLCAQKPFHFRLDIDSWGRWSGCLHTGGVYLLVRVPKCRKILAQEVTVILECEELRVKVLKHVLCRCELACRKPYKNIL